jgi:hypothetical protein
MGFLFGSATPRPETPGSHPGWEPTVTPLEVGQIFAGAEMLRAAHRDAGGGDEGAAAAVTLAMGALIEQGDTRAPGEIAAAFARDQVLRYEPEASLEGAGLVAKIEGAWVQVHGRSPTADEVRVQIFRLAWREIEARVEAAELAVAASAEGQA